MDLLRNRRLHLLAALVSGLVIFGACGSEASVDDAATVAEADSEMAEAESDDAVVETTSSVPDANAEQDAEPTDDDIADESEAVSAEPVSYDGSFASSIQPIFEEKCSSCHYDGGPGAFHWNLRTAQDVVDTHLLVSDVITTNYMPPWPAGGDSVAFVGDRSLSEDQIQAVLDWVEDGAPIDVAPDAAIEPSSPVVGLANPDLVIEPPQPYAGDPNVTDDYRCQIYDPELPDGGWITSYEFLPDQDAVVHHAIGYLLPDSERTRAAQRDGEDGRPGWECYGASGLGESDIFLGWAPGQDPTVFPEGTGLWVPPGGFVVVQIHYHYEGDAPADNSAFAMVVEEPDVDLEELVITQFFAPAEIPCASWESGPLCDRDAAHADALARFGADGVQADRFNRICRVTPEDFAHFTDGVAESSCSIPAAMVGASGEIQSILLHMHEIGAWTRMTINKGTPAELVLVDIPVWDFDWQYNYEPVDAIVLDADDVITLECGWDRSLRRADLEPAWILWADGTNDEMCFANLTTREA